MSEQYDYSTRTRNESDSSPPAAGCDVCGEGHETDSCPLLGEGVRVEDAIAPSRARLTMPANLRAKTLKDGTVTVVARENIPANTRFGPFEAPRRTVDEPATAGPQRTKFPLKVFNNRDSSVTNYLDIGGREDVCNWMCLVLPAESHEEQNLMAFQVLQDVFFSSKRDIRIHEELKVWYAPHYGKKMGVDPLVPAAVTCSSVSASEEPSNEISKEPVASPTPADAPRMRRGRRKRLFKEYIGIEDDDVDDVEISGSTSSPMVDPKRLGFQAQRDWRCSQCSKVYNNCIDFARHLRDHYHPQKLKAGERKKKKKGVAGVARPKSFECQFCPSKFSSGKLLQRHRLRLHRRLLRRNKTIDPAAEDNGRKYMSENDAATILLEMEANCDATEGGEAEVKCDPAVFGITVKAETIASENDESAVLRNKDVALQCISARYDMLLLEGKEVQSTEIVLDDFVEGADVMITANEEPEDDDAASTAKVASDDADATFDSMDIAVEAQALKDPTEKCNDGDYVCDICSKGFDKSIYLFRHIRKHTGEFACSKCQKAFARKESLLKHACMGLTVDDTDESVQQSFLCNFCHKSFESRHLLKRHVSKHTGDFTCGKCAKSYCSKDILENHVCSESHNPGTFSCEICQKTFTKLKYLDKHIPVHTGAHTCPICGKWLRSHDSLVNHMRICGQVKELEINGLAPCPHCRQEFRDLQSFRRHIYEHTHLFSCESCGARFRNKATLASHVCDALGDSNMVCEKCGKTFGNSLSLKRHKSTHEDKIIKCQDCGFTFEGGEACETGVPKHECKGQKSETPARRKLRRQPSLQPLICEVCGSLFSSTSSLNVHKRLHGEKLFSCEECGKRFHRKDLMLDHCAVHGAPAIPCPVCDKMFKTKKSLDVHLLIHDGVKRFTCATCGKQFYQKGNLIKHEEVHNPDRKYPCTVCTKAFSTKEYLAIHVLEHTRGRIFNCGACDKSFVKEHQLKAHQRIFHTNLAYVCRFCGLHVKLKHSLKRHLSKKHSDQKQLWNSANQIEEMLVAQQEFEAVAGQDFPNADEEELEPVVQEAEVLLAVTRIRTEELQQALASGSAHFQQGAAPNTIEISLPIDQSLPDAIMVETGDDGEQLETHIIQLPLTTEQVADVDDTDLRIEDGRAENEHVNITVEEEGQDAHVTVIDDLPSNGTLQEGTIVLENGTILQQGISIDGTDVLFYVFTSDNEDCNRALTDGEDAN